MDESGTTNFKCSLRLDASRSSVYEALTTQAGIRRWWTESSDVDPRVGGRISIRFGQTFKEMQIDVLQADTEVRWRVLAANLVVPGLSRADEWVGTTIVFQLEPEAAQVTRLHLTHIGLTPQVECFELCSQGWLQFLDSLKRYVETGTGAPYADRAT